MLHRQTNKKNLIKSESSDEVFWKLFPDGKGEERAASADCKLGGFQHKIFKWQDRIVKQKTVFYYFKDKHELLEGNFGRKTGV
jgi:hypothetical protein